MGFRDNLPPSVAEIVQNGLLDGIFQDALKPTFLYDSLADLKPWASALGSQSIFTRAGLMTPNATAITGADATAATYPFEQYSVKMDQFGNSIDTNLAVSAQAMASKFVEDNKILGINAAQSLNLLAQNTLYGAYGEGTTYGIGNTSSVTVPVADASGFLYSSVVQSTTSTVNGVLGAPSIQLNAVGTGANALPITINGVAASCVGATVTANHASDTITLAVAQAVTAGWPIVASNAPVQYRPNARASASQLVAGDIATLSLFESAVTRLRQMNVPTVNGAYQAHVGPATVNELFQDANFRQVYQGRFDSPAYTSLTLGSGVEYMGRFIGIDWFLNNVTPAVTSTTGPGATQAGTLQVFRPIVCGDGPLIKAPFENMGDLLAGLNAGSTVQIDMIGGVARVWRAPLDRLGQVVSSTWSFIGGYCVGTDLNTGDAAAYKRAVVIEHV